MSRFPTLAAPLTTARAPAGAVLLLLPSLAFAQVLGEFDFETPADGGGIHLNVLGTGVQYDQLGAAAHRDLLGARFDKAVVASPDRSLLSFTPIDQTTVYSRFWIRWNRIDPATDAVVFLSLHRVSPGGAVFALSARNGATQAEYEIDMNGQVDGGQSRTSTFPTGVVVDRQWHLIELRSVIEGAFVQCAAAIDGNVVFSRRSPDQSSGLFTYQELGVVYLYNDLYGGQFDLDDLRLSSAPLPSRWRLDGPAELARSACTPIRAELTDAWDGGVTSTSQPAELTVDAQGVEVFSEATCSSRGAITVSANASSVTFFVRPTSQPIALQARSVDLLPSNTLAPTLGTGDYRIACDCSSASGALTVLSLGLVTLRRRRARG